MSNAGLMISVSGVRGRVGEALTPELIATYAAAFGAWAKQQSAKQRSAEQRSAEQRSAEQRSAEQRSAEQRSMTAQPRPEAEQHQSAKQRQPVVAPTHPQATSGEATRSAVVVGRDSRVSGAMFHRVVLSALQSVGCD